MIHPSESIGRRLLFYEGEIRRSSPSVGPPLTSSFYKDEKKRSEFCATTKSSGFRSDELRRRRRRNKSNASSLARREAGQHLALVPVSPGNHWPVACLISWPTCPAGRPAVKACGCVPQEVSLSPHSTPHDNYDWVPNLQILIRRHETYGPADVYFVDDRLLPLCTRHPLKWGGKKKTGWLRPLPSSRSVPTSESIIASLLLVAPPLSLSQLCGRTREKKKVEWEMGRRDESEGGEERKRERKKEKRRTLTRPPTPTWFDSFWLKTLTSLGSSLLSPSIHLFLPSPLSI